jgi:hypothetical protein
MTVLDSGPCQNWTPLCDDFPENPTDPQQQLIFAAVQAATEVLWERTHRRFGLCSMPLRPCRRDCANAPAGWQDYSGYGWPFPVLDRGVWVNLGCRGCGTGCSCTSVSVTRLPSPVAEVTEVKIDGAALDPASYRVDDWRWLVRLDGEWPSCQDLTKADTEAGTWSVTASYGEVVPTLGSLAVGQLAFEIYKACPGSGSSGDCALPSATVRQITRQGVTKVFFDAATAFKGGTVGLYFPDLFVATYNPGGHRQAKVYDIDRPKASNVGSIPGPVGS